MRIGRVVGIFESNVFVCGDEKNCVIIDAGADLSQVREMVASRHVFAVFLTHGHFDHALHATDYAKFFNCKVFAHKNAKECLRDDRKNASGGRFEFSDFSDFEFFEKSTAFSWFSLKIEAIDAGGHTTSDVVFRIENHVFVGDLLLEGTIGRTDFPGGNAEKMKQSLEKIRALNFDILHSGHGADCTKKEADRIASSWIEML